MIYFVRFLTGVINVRIKGFSTERFINLCKNKHIKLWNIKSAGSNCDFRMYPKDFKEFLAIRRKTGVKIRITKRRGLPFILHRYRKHVGFLAGGILFFTLLYILSLFVWDININGNSIYSDKVIMDYLNSIDIFYGSKKSEITCYDVEMELRKKFPELTWVSADLKGTRLTITVKENSDDVIEIPSDEPCDLICHKDGYIASIITRTGTPKVKIGDEVHAGDVLVSSLVEIKNESDEVLRTEYVHGDADIYIMTSYEYEDILHRAYVDKVYTGEENKSFSIQLGKKLFTFDWFGNNYDRYDTVSSQEQLHLYNNFYLPVTFINGYDMEYELVDATYTDEELNSILNKNLTVYVQKLEERGIQILDNGVKIETDDNQGTARGLIKVIEKTGNDTEPVIEEEGTTADERN